MVRREDYIHKQPDLTRDRWLDVYAEARQNNAEVEGRNPGEAVFSCREEAVYGNKVGLLGEWACMVYLSIVRWNYFKRGRITGIPDLWLEPRPGLWVPPWMDAKTNRVKYPTNYLLVPQHDDPRWIYIHCYIDDPVLQEQRYDDKNWVLMRPWVVIVGWCFGFEAQSKNLGLRAALGRDNHQIPHDDNMLRPMQKLRVLLDLCRAHGEDRALDLWRERGESYEPGQFKAINNPGCPRQRLQAVPEDFDR